MKKDSVGIEALRNGNNIVTNPIDKVEILTKEYESVFTHENLENIPKILPSPYPDMENFEITENGVLTLQYMLLSRGVQIAKYKVYYVYKVKWFMRVNIFGIWKRTRYRHLK